MYHVPWAFYLPKPFILMNHAIPNQLTRKFLNSSKNTEVVIPGLGACSIRERQRVVQDDRY